MSAATNLAAFRAGRRRYLGGTDAAAIAGLSPWASPLSVYLDKIGESHDDRETLAMRRGLALEDFIADEFTRARPGLVTFKPRSVVRIDWGFPAGASIDRMVAEKHKPRTPIAVLDMKAALRFGYKQFDAETGELPDHYYVQLQWYMAVAELPRGYIAADVGDEDLRIVEIPPNEQVQQQLIKRAHGFWTNHVEPRIPPEPNGSEGDYKALSRMWPETIPEPPLELGADADATLSDYLAHKFKAEEHGREADAAKQKLCALMGEREAAILPGWRMTWKPQTRKSIDTKALRAAHPAIAEEFTRESTSRVFLCREMH